MSTTTDPVCGMKVDSESRHSVEHAGGRYYFCSQHCLEKFQASPAKYLDPVAADAVRPSGRYSCPMHPEVRQTTPGSCPKCGMALEEESTIPVAAGIVRPLRFGTGGMVLMLAIYFGVVGLISGMDFAVSEFVKYWYFFLPLALGFGIQVGLFIYLRNLVGQHGASSKVVAVSGTTSTAAMVSCCAHYLANIVPILGIAGFLTVVAEYQVELFWVGLAFNAAGLLYVTSKVINAYKEHKKCANNS